MLLVVVVLAPAVVVAAIVVTLLSNRDVHNFRKYFWQLQVMLNLLS